MKSNSDVKLAVDDSLKFAQDFALFIKEQQVLELQYANQLGELSSRFIVQVLLAMVLHLTLDESNQSDVQTMAK